MKTKTKPERSTAKENKKIGQLLATLRDGDGFAKEKAAEALLAYPDGPSVVKGVAPLLKANETGTRMIALDILKQIGNCNIDVITSLLDDENEDVRVYGCEIIIHLKHADTIPHLIRKMFEDADNVRNLACMALGEFNDERAVDALLEALKDDDWVTFSAILSLGKIGDKKAIPSLLDVFRNGSEEISLAACETLMDFKDSKVLDEVMEALKGWDEKKRDGCIKVMLEKGDEEVFLMMKDRISDELLGHLLSCVKYEHRRALPIMKLLAHFKTPAACNAILDTLAALDTEVEEYDEILECLIDLKDVWAEDIDDYISKGEQYAFTLIRACRMGGVRIGEKLLHDVFVSAPVEVRREIIGNIENIVDGSGLLIINEAIRDPDGHVQGDAVAAAGRLDFAQLKEEVRELSRRSYPDVRAKALKALIKLDLTEATAVIEQFVASGSPDDKKVFLATASTLDNERNFPFLSKLLEDDDDGVRKATIGVFGNFLSDERYMNILTSLLKAEDIPHEALKVVKEKRLTAFKGRLIDLFENPERGMWTRYYALSALDSFQDHSLYDLFLKGLEDENNLIKIGSVKALSDLDDPRALIHIEPLTRSDDEDIRVTAETAVRRLENL